MKPTTGLSIWNLSRERSQQSHLAAENRRRSVQLGDIDKYSRSDPVSIESLLVVAQPVAIWISLNTRMVHLRRTNVM
jgi:hypothetical protein